MNYKAIIIQEEKNHIINQINLPLTPKSQKNSYLTSNAALQHANGAHVSAQAQPLHFKRKPAGFFSQSRNKLLDDRFREKVRNSIRKKSKLISILKIANESNFFLRLSLFLSEA